MGGRGVEERENNWEGRGWEGVWMEGEGIKREWIGKGVDGKECG